MTKPSKWVRVRDEKTGHHITVPAAVVDSKRHKYRPLKSSPVDVNGRALAPTTNISTRGDANPKPDNAAPSTPDTKEAK